MAAGEKEAHDSQQIEQRQSWKPHQQPHESAHRRRREGQNRGGVQHEEIGAVANVQDLYGVTPTPNDIARALDSPVEETQQPPGGRRHIQRLNRPGGQHHLRLGQPGQGYPASPVIAVNAD